MSEEVIEVPAKVEDSDNQKEQWSRTLAVRMADEGIPIGAIIRVIRQPSDFVRPALKEAQAKGIILTIPRDDWPPGSRRSERMPDCAPMDIETESLVSTLMRVFKVTPAQAMILTQLVKRPEVTKSSLHLCVQRDGAEPTDPKIVDVLVCHLRKRLPSEIKIETIWGRGYYMSPASKLLVMQRIEAYSG